MPDTDPRTEYAHSSISIAELNDDALTPPVERPADRADRASAGTREDLTQDKAGAAEILDSIGRDFVRLRAEGRSGAWAELEDRLMSNFGLLVGSGLISTKDLVGTARDIEDFRKQELGTQQPPGDWLKEWLSKTTEEQEPKPEVVVHLPKKERKPRTPKVIIDTAPLAVGMVKEATK